MTSITLNEDKTYKCYVDFAGKCWWSVDLKTPISISTYNEIVLALKAAQLCDTDDYDYDYGRSGTGGPVMVLFFTNENSAIVFKLMYGDL